MLSETLYNLCLLLSTPYENLNLISNNTDYVETSILHSIYIEKLSKFYYRKKIKSSFKNFHFDYCYNLLEKYINLFKLVLNLKISFIIDDTSRNILSTCIHKYVIILEKIQNKYRIKFILENEENPTLYDYILNENFQSIADMIFSKAELSSEFTLFSSSNKNFITRNLFSRNNIDPRISFNFNIDTACTYAETYALNPNPEYKSFDGIGGDCTNFMSQILHAGGIKLTPTWKPYTNSWIRVEDIYLYLTSHKLCTKLPDDTSLDRGCLIQFYTPAIGRFFHNGFITYKLQNNDCLYCCHSYNKLNYPLSEIYPKRYPKLRALKFV